MYLFEDRRRTPIVDGRWSMVDERQEEGREKKEDLLDPLVGVAVSVVVVR